MDTSPGGLTLEELAQRTAPRTSRDPGLKSGPLPRRARHSHFFIDVGQVTDTQAVPLTGDELAALADRLDKHATSEAGPLLSLPVTIEITERMVRARGRTLTEGEVAALSAHIQGLARS